MIYLQAVNSHSRSIFMFTLKQSFKEYIKQKNTIRHLYRITIKLFKYAYISSHVGHTYTILFTCIINSIQKKENQSSV